MRSIWNGSVSFGLVNIPVRLYSATESISLPLDMIDSNTGHRIRYKRVNEKSGEEVPYEEIVKGYKTEEGYVLLTKEDFDTAHSKKSQTIEIDEFVEEDEVIEMLYKKPYYLEPHKGGKKAYSLLLAALKETNKVGIATFVLRQKENLCVLSAHEKVIVLHMIRFPNEIRDYNELNIPDEKPDKKQLDMAKKLVESYSDKFDFESYEDTYTDKVMEIIDAKRKGKKPEAKIIPIQPTEATDIMDKLKESLKKKKKAS